MAKVLYRALVMKYTMKEAVVVVVVVVVSGNALGHMARLRGSV